MDYDDELDVRGLKCPLPILRTKKALAAMDTGKVLRVVATDPSTVKDFDAFARQTGHELLSRNDPPADEFVFLIRRK
ncbi:MAG: sulfurtransferase TusA family protein [Moraxellaceae bacterium]|nr:sulfurtransferase TusA family protein [Moraxellaceae bacterium]